MWVGSDPINRLLVQHRPVGLPVADAPQQVALELWHRAIRLGEPHKKAPYAPWSRYPNETLAPETSRPRSTLGRCERPRSQDGSQNAESSPISGVVRSTSATAAGSTPRLSNRKRCSRVSRPCQES